MTDKNEIRTYTDEELEELKVHVVAAIEAGLFEKEGPWYKSGELVLGRTPDEIVEKLKEEPELAGAIVAMMAPAATEPDPPQGEPPAEEPSEEPKKPASELVDKKNPGKSVFKITLPDPHVGPDHGVTFAHGVGVLSLFGMSFHRPEWVEHDSKKGWKQSARAKLPILEPLLDFFQAKGAVIEKISELEGEKLINKIRTDPDSFAPVVEEEPEAVEAKGNNDKGSDNGDKKPHEV